jgi:hypothetical protein
MEMVDESPTDKIDRFLGLLNLDETRRILTVTSEVLTGFRRELSIRDSSIDEHFLAIEKSIEVAHSDLVRVPTDVQKAVQALRELLEQVVATHSADMIGKFNATHDTVALLRHDMQDLPRQIDEKVAHLGSVSEEKFESIKAQFVEKDKATDKLSIADKTALAAALQTQKESALATSENSTAALNKMENNFTKLFEQQSATLAAIKQNSDEKINDVKSRLDRGEGKSDVANPAVTEALRVLAASVSDLTRRQDNSSGHRQGVGDFVGWIVGGVGLLVAIASVVISVIVHTAPQPVTATVVPGGQATVVR